MKVWGWAGIELTTPGSAVGHTADSATRPGKMVVIWTGNDSKLVKIANREDTDQTASSEAV